MIRMIDQQSGFHEYVIQFSQQRFLQFNAPAMLWSLVINEINTICNAIMSVSLLITKNNQICVQHSVCLHKSTSITPMHSPFTTLQKCIRLAFNLFLCIHGHSIEHNYIFCRHSCYCSFNQTMKIH